MRFPRSLILVVLLFLFQGLIFYYQTVRPFSLAPAGTVYNGLGNPTYFGYTAYIRQIKDGLWGVRDPYTTRPTPVIYAQPYFIVLGKLAAILSVDPMVMFQAARVAGAVALFAASYWFVTALLPTAVGHIGILLMLLIETGPYIPMLQPAAGSVFLPAFDTQALIDRHFGLPHHTMGEAVMLLFMGMTLLYFRTPSAKRGALIILSGFIASLLLPPYVVVFLFALAGVWLWHIIRTRKIDQFSIGSALALAATIPPMLFTKLQYAKGTPWVHVTAIEKTWTTSGDVLTRYGFSLLPFLPLILAAIILGIRFGKQIPKDIRVMTLLAVLFLAAPFLLVPISRFEFFPLANFRITDGYAYGLAGALATIGIWMMMRIKTRHAGRTRAILLGFTIACSVFLTHQYTQITLGRQSAHWANIYITQSNWQAMHALTKVPVRSGVISSDTMGNLIPGIASVRTFFAGAQGVPDWQERRVRTAEFFQGTLTDEQALAFLMANDISYVYYGDQERTSGITLDLYPTILVPVFSDGITMVYKVKQ